VQVEEGPDVAFTVEKSGALPALVIVTAVEEGRTVVEMAASQAPLEPPAGAGSGGADVVMVPSDLDSVPPPPAGDHEVAMPEPSPTAGAAEPSSAAGVVTVEEVMELATCQYVDLPGIGIIDFDVPELPSNDQEMLEVATERMFAEPSILETIVSVTLAQRQYESAGGTAPPATSV
jgi:hypothetical protein